ncbi:MAG: hypothetical protein QM770_14740 [Tepidisphaeraceae bacterium]
MSTSNIGDAAHTHGFRRLILLAATAGLWFTGTAIAQVLYSDGASHTIPGDPAFSNGQSVWLSSASSLNILSGATVTGPAALSNQPMIGGFGILASDGTAIAQTGGAVTGGAGTVIADGASPPTVLAAGGLAVATSGTYAGTGGSITGGLATAEANIGSIQTEGGLGLYLNNATSAALAGTTLTGGDANSGKNSVGSAYEVLATGGAALRVGNGGPTTINSGSFTGGNGWAESNTVGFGSATGTGGVAVDVRGTANVTINGGNFQGGIGSGLVNLSNAPGVGVGGGALRVQGPSTVTINGGAFTVGSSSAGTIPPTTPLTTAQSAVTVVGDELSGQFTLAIHSGTFTGLHAIETTGASPNLTVARIDITGGTLQASSGQTVIELANPNVLTSLIGSNFALNGLPLSPGLVSETQGTLTGTLASGSTFSWSFHRANNAPLQVAAVPEPMSGVLAASSILLLWRVGRR